MKRIFRYLPLVLALPFFFAACSDDANTEPVTPPAADPALTLAQTELAVPAEGGHFEVNYTLENPVAGAKLHVSVSDEAWIRNLDSSVEGKISFDVLASYADAPRTCRVELTYPGVYPNPLLTITQAKGLEPSFTFRVTSVMSNTIKMDVLPKDKEQPYIFLLGKKQYMVEENLLEDDAAQVASDMEVISDFGAAFGAQLKDVVVAFMYEGDQIGYLWNGVERDTDYIAYAYGFDVETLQPTTEICRVEIHTLDVELFRVDFDFDVTTHGPYVDFTITPSGYDGPYFFGIFAAEDCPRDASEEMLISYCESAWEQEKGVYSGFFETPEEGYHFILNELAYHGATTFKDVELLANTEYVLWAFGMNEEGLLNTVPDTHYFTTGQAQSSTNEFEITISDIKARQATVSVTPTTQDPYVATLVRADRFTGMDEQEIMDEVLTWNYTLIEGSFTTVADELLPDTGYEILVFGVNGGRPSTALTRKGFTTAEAVTSTAKFELKYDKFYDLEELAAIDEAWAAYEQFDILLPVEVLTDERVVNVYYEVLDLENFNFYTPSQLTEALLKTGPSEEVALLALDYDIPFIFFGFAEDEDGNFTEFWQSGEEIFRKENRSPASELFEQETASAKRAVRTPQNAFRPRTSKVAGKLTVE